MAYYEYKIYYDSTSTLRYTATKENAVNVSYNGTSQTSLSNNKTISCGGYIMRGDLTIGAKTLSCKDKMMKSNVQVNVSAISITSVSQYGSSSGYYRITVGWKVNTASQYTGVRICAKTGSYPSSISDNVKYTGAGSLYSTNVYQYTLTGLGDDTTYYVKIWPYVLSNGVYCWGTPIQFTQTTWCSNECDCDNDCYSCSCDNECKGECSSECDHCSCDCDGPAYY